ncbi:5-hydroxytryptamine receptor 1B-like [Paramacrobiotus metropolitanus]|uniref:5-hydroxytryptamine receptor 1B-like n=1 Tax=Paramacrobiotus metropolitanus TaxID=2943436 RepID=UPI002445C22C|nr:5-hydroxytryptamine receptor 1B-like [Paramacrobiotus metropolitanus]
MLNSTINSSFSGGYAQRGAKFMGYLYLSLTIFSYLSNAFFLFIYYKSPSLKTPFSVYVVSLAICDLCKSLTNGISKTTNNLQMRWFLGDGYCLLALYSSQALTSMMMYIQVLISFNRFWAVTFPNNYRTHHNKKIAVCLVIVAVAFVNVWYLPGFLTEEIRNRTQEQVRMCTPAFGGGKSVYFYLSGTIIHLLPQALVIVMYPFIYYKVKGVMRKKAHIGKTRVEPEPTVESQMTSNSRVTTTTLIGRGRKVSDASRLEEMSMHAVPQEKAGNKNRVKKPPGRIAKAAAGTRHFAVLTTLLISATLFWTPTHLASILMMSGKSVSYTFLGVANFLFALDCTMNPLLCLLASKEWRDAVKTTFRCY